VVRYPAKVLHCPQLDCLGFTLPNHKKNSHRFYRERLLCLSEGVYLFRLRARHEAPLKPLEMVATSIHAQLAAQNQQRLWKELQGRLWSSDAVMVREDLLKAAIVGARVADFSEQASPKN